MGKQDRPVRVLVADDNKDVCETLASLLRLEGYLVDCVGDGVAALEAVRDLRHDVCILDIFMPRPSGDGVAQELRRIYGSRRPFIVAISGEQVASVYRKEAGGLFDVFLQKPADPSEVLRVLSDVSGHPRRQ